MTPTKRSFWRNFWGETGRNTGKWASNKIFGVTGWATPRRIIFDGLDKNSIEKVKKLTNNSTPEPTNLDNQISGFNDIKNDEIHKHNFAEEKELLDLNEEYEEQQLYAEARKVNFNIKNTGNISSQLDKLLTAAFTAANNNMNIDVYVSRINTGIILLRRLNENKLADHYTEEKQRLVVGKKRKNLLLILVFVVVLTALVYFAFFYKSASDDFLSKILGFFK